MTDIKPTLETIGRIYSASVRRHGASHHGVGWSSLEGQMRRLAALMALFHGEKRPSVSVADLGCGYGVLWPLLAARKNPYITRYIGLDIAPDMIDLARRQHGHDERVSFQAGSLPSAAVDYGLVSGTFNYRRDCPEETWQRYVADSLATFAATCQSGMAFNLLRRSSSPTYGSMYYGDPTRWLAFANALVAARGGTASLDTGYLPDDFTVLMRFPSVVVTA